MIDKSIVLTDSVVDDLLDDWLERDGEGFTKIRKKGRICWEDTLEKDESYSAYFLEAPTDEDLIKRAYSLAKDMIVVMDPPFKVHIRISPGSSSYTDFKQVCVSTKMFDDKELSNGEKLDVFLGTAIHEGCHLLYTNPREMERIMNKIVSSIFNIIEDERIEELCGQNKPGLANFIAKSKYYYFDQFYLDYLEPRERSGSVTTFDRLMSLFLRVIRYPKYLREEEVIEFGHYLLAIKDVVIPYPITTAQAVNAAFAVYEIVKDFYTEEEEERMKKEKSEKSEEDSDSSDESSEDSEGDESEGGEKEPELSDAEKELAKRMAEERMKKDGESLSDALSKVMRKVELGSDGSVSGTLTEDETAKAVAKDGGLLGEICEGKVELGSGDDTFFTKSEDNRYIYQQSLARVKRFVPAISKILKGHCREYKLIHKAMRSGVLDTSKLAEAYQGVPTVYMREGEVKTDKVSVCVVIDESGSMGGRRIEAARDTAILINEAVGSIPNVELFIYGHSGDMRKSYATELYVYREKGFAPPYSLGSVQARCENRDGVAIVEIAKRVRRQTKNPVLMFILSDGAPSAGGYRGDSAIQHTKNCVTKCEQMGFDVVQVCINHSYDPGRMFKHFVILEDMSKLAHDLGKVIKKATMNAAKVRIT